MDFTKFYEWRKHYSLIEVSATPAGGVGFRPETCHGVFDILVEDGLAFVAEKSTSGKVRTYKLTDAGTAQLPAARKDARRLMNELVKENEKLVRKIVNQLFKRQLQFTEEEDLYQSGLMALCRTLEKFDPSRFSNKSLGGSFASYLRHWIRDYTQKSTLNQQTIRHPKGFGMPFPIHKKIEDFKARHGRAPTAQELGSYKTKGGKEVPVTEDKLLKWQSAMNSVVSLDAAHDNGPRDQERSATQGFVASDVPDSSKSPQALYEAEEQRLHAEYLIAGLDSREKTVLYEMREGSSDHKIATILGVHRITAMHLRHAVIKKLAKRAKRPDLVPPSSQVPGQV